MQFPRTSMILVAASLMALAGCRKEETIEQFTIEHKDRESLELRVAILPHQDYVWFIRLSGPESLMKEQTPAFEEFVKSVRFDDKKGEAPISWTEPKTWKKDPPVAERYASYRIETKPKPLEVKITFFPRKKYELLPNLHRWQDEMNLPHMEEKEIGRFVTEDKIGAQEVTWVKMAGLGTYKISKPIEAAAEVKKKLPPAQAPQADVPFQYKLPVGWVAKKPRDQFSVALFEVAEKDEVAQSYFDAAGG